MFNRLIKFPKNSSFFLFGARGTGKSFLLRHRFSVNNSVIIDLLDPDTFLRYNLNPSVLLNFMDSLSESIQWIIIDEVQKIPQLLDIVHKHLSEGSKKKFILTGSSARKLKRGGANMLAGRAFVYNLYPLTYLEIGEQFNLQEVLKYGSLPAVFSFESGKDKNEFLRSYHYTYITQEITEEQTIRKLDPFRKFLSVAAQMSGKIINYSKIAREVGITTPTVISYFQILQDTLLGQMLESYHTSIRKSQKENPKFFFFDTGVLRALSNTLTLDVLPQTYIYGELFEHFIINQINWLQNYYKKDYRLYYIRTKSGLEIDLIIERPGKKTILLEVKSTENVTREQILSFENLAKDIPNSIPYCFSRDKISKKFGSVKCLNWQEGIGELF